MPFSWIALLLAGAVLGWLTSVILRSVTPRDVLGLVALGTLGALIGAMVIAPILAGRLEPTGFSLPAVLLSLLGAFLALGLTIVAQRIGRRRRRR